MLIDATKETICAERSLFWIKDIEKQQPKQSGILKILYLRDNFSKKTLQSGIESIDPYPIQNVNI